MKIAKQKFVVTAIMLTFIVMASVSYADPNKVYTVDANKLVDWAIDKGHTTNTKKLNNFSSCEVIENTMKVRRNAKIDPPADQQASCVFTFFSPGKLAKGWKVQEMTVIFNGNGKWRYLNKPQGKRTLLTIIRATQVVDNAFDLELKLKDIVLVGPGDSTSWKQALP